MSYQYRRMLNISVCTVLINKMIDMSNAILQLMTHKGWLHLRRFQNCNKINVKMGIFILNVEMWLVILFSTLFVISTYRNAPKLLYIWSIANWVKKKVKYSVHEKYFLNIKYWRCDTLRSKYELNHEFKRHWTTICNIIMY